MDNADPLVWKFLVLLSFVLLYFVGLAEQLYRQSNLKRIEYGVKNGVKGAKLYLWAVKYENPHYLEVMWTARIVSLIITVITTWNYLFLPASFLISDSIFNDYGRGFMVFVYAFLGVIVVNILPKIHARKLGLQPTTPGRYLIVNTIFLLFLAPSILFVRLLRRFAQLIDQEPTGLLIFPDFPNSESLNFMATSVPEPEVALLQKALDFAKVKARDCVVPRNEIVGIDINSGIPELVKTFLDTRFSKILIYQDTSDNIIGYVHSYDLFRNPKEIKNILLPVLSIPETLSAQDVFQLFIKQKRSIAIVIDEFGGNLGMVTIEDLLEEIFGDINDEHDIPELHEEELKEGCYVFSGRFEIDYLNNKYNLNIPTSVNYDTLAGYVLDQFDDLPEANACINNDLFEITVCQVTDARIELVELKLKPEN